jgi:sigma-B regulation protein RsbU (phosphoserine phosphatase)
LSAPVAWSLVAKGAIVGAMVIDGGTQPVATGTRHANILAGIASQTAMAIVNAQLTEEAVARQRLEQELEVARKIQQSFLPESCPSPPGWQICAFWQSARQVGGDFYDFVSIRDGTDRLGIAIADVADKGVPAALFMALSRTLLRAAAIGGRTASETLMRANDLILNDVRSDLFVTIFYLVLDPATTHIGFANAGHNPPVLARAADDPPEYLRRHGIALGVTPGIHLDEQTLTVRTGDVLVLYTDGVTEALDEAGEEFGLERFERCILEHRHGTADEIAEAIHAALHAHIGGGAPFDDVTLVVMKRVNG